MRFGGLIAAIVFAVIAAVAVMWWSSNNTASQAVPVQAGQTEIKSVNVYVAAKPIPVGTALTADMVAAQPWPEHLALESFVRADGKTDVVGMVARGAFQQSEPLMGAKLANPNDPNFLAGDLPKGMRVITIPVNETDGVAGFVFPGDTVDVIYTHDVPKWVEEPTFGSASAPDEAVVIPKKTMQTVTETLLTNVKILAVDQRASNAGSTDAKGNLIIPKSASLMVAQADAQRIRLAQRTGVLSLVLRSIADKESADPLTLTSGADITQSQDGSDGLATGGKTEKIIIRRGQQQEIQSSQSGNARKLGGAPVAVNQPSSVKNPVGVTVPAGNDVITPGLMAIP